ncbi:MAG: hypothetical protein M3P98_02390 [bacterium]|nr:hypothetical protein [bacterium]
MSIEADRKDVVMDVVDLQRFGGVGVVTPTDLYTDDQVTLAVEEAQKPIAENVAVCIDERPAVSEQPVRPKKAGGMLTDIFAASVVESPVVPLEVHKKGVIAVMRELASVYGRLDMPIGGHGGSEACGASANFVQISRDAADQGPHFVEAAKEDLGDIFDQTVWDGVVADTSLFADVLEKAAGSDEDSDEAWDPKKFESLVKTAAEEGRGVFEELTGENLHSDLDPTNKRHGHWAEAIKRNRKPGTSNDRDHSPIESFQVDVWKIAEDSQKLAVDEKDFARQLHAAALFQYATAYRLTSKQRLV